MTCVSTKRKLGLLPLGFEAFVIRFMNTCEVVSISQHAHMGAFLTSAAAYRNLGQNLWGPHRYGCLNDVQVSCVFSGPCAAHSLLITTEGKLWSWGKSRINIDRDVRLNYMCIRNLLESV